MALLVQNRHLNGYTFVIRVPGCVSIKCNQDLIEAQQAVLYLTKLGARFVAITHDNYVETSKKLNHIFGFNLTSHTHAYVTPNTPADMNTIMQKIRRSGQPIHSGRQLIYLDNYDIYIYMITQF